MNEIIDALN